MDNKRIAVIDLGSNTFHLLIVETKSGKIDFKEVFREREFIYLAAGGMDTLSDDKIRRALACLSKFKKHCNDHNVDKVVLVGTSALRNASNSLVFLDAVKQALNWEIQIISGDREAELIFLGNQKYLSLPANAVILDIGGGSTETIIIKDGKLHGMASRKLGVSYLRSIFPVDQYNQATRLKMLNDHLDKEWQILRRSETNTTAEALIGASGPFEILEGLEGLAKDNGPHFIDRSKTLYWCNLIETLNFEERLALPGMPPERADLSIESMALIKWMLTCFANIQSVIISPYALKEGVIAENI